MAHAFAAVVGFALLDVIWTMIRMVSGQSVGVTTGVLYHHFGSKEGLYAVVREELERRVVDRMDGDAAVLRMLPIMLWRGWY